MRAAWRQVVAAGERHRFIASWLAVVPVVMLGELFPRSEVQLYVIMAGLVVALVFIAAYLPEHPGQDWFGTSLLNLAVAWVIVGVVAALVRIYGPQPWHQYPVSIWLGLTLVALIGRTWVLLHGQWVLRRHLGGWLRARLHKMKGTRT